MKRTVTQIAVAAGIALAYGAGVLTAPAETPATPAPDMVHVGIVYEESGEARSIELTDSEGNDVPVGSVAEEWPYLEVDYSGEEN